MGPAVDSIGALKYLFAKLCKKGIFILQGLS